MADQQDKTSTTTTDQAGQGSDFISLGGMWLKKNAQGEYFMVGNLGFNGKILMFKNKNKKSDNSPDYFLYLAPAQDKGKDKPNATDPNEPPF